MEQRSIGDRSIGKDIALEKQFTSSFMRRMLAVACLCLLTLSLALTASTAHAASSSRARMTAQNFRQYIHLNTSSSHPAAAAAVTLAPNLTVYYQFQAHIQSRTGLYVSEEQSYGGGNKYEMRARTAGSALGPWEVFNFYTDASGSYWYIQSNSTGLYATEEQNDTGIYKYMLRARTAGSALGPWEVFNLYVDGNGYWNIQSNNNGLYVSEEEGYGGNDKYLLRARTAGNATGTWEEYSFV